MDAQFRSAVISMANSCFIDPSVLATQLRWSTQSLKRDEAKFGASSSTKSR